MSTRLSETDRRRAFFYAEAESDVYDAAADLSTPLYSLMQATLLDLVEEHSRIRHREGNGRLGIEVLDIGSGSGAEGLGVLDRIPESHLVAFDLCAPMHDVFKAKVAARADGGALLSRCDFVIGDVVDVSGRPEALVAPLRRRGRERYDVVISTLAIHHLTSVEKREAYGRIAAVLEDGGLFVNADLFSFQSPVLTEQAHRFLIDWIDRQFTNPDPHLRAAAEALGERREALRAAWIEHCENFNLPEPVESASESTRPPEQSPGTMGQASALLEAGFREVGCPFRYYQVGILWALK